MPKTIVIFVLLVVFTINVKAQVPIGLGWAKNAVNTTIFRKNSVVSHKGYQFVAYYDSVGYVVLAKRKLTTNNWQVQRTNFKGNVKDAHNVISIMIDGDGFVHLSWNHHGNVLHYSKSIAPFGLEMSPEMPMTGVKEAKVTYPEFYRLANGDLLFFYRDGSSGNGNFIINKYNIATKAWQRLQDVLINGEGKRNAYWQACVDVKGTIHVSWVWRESADVSSNHDMCYAASDDGGVSWRKSNGAVYALPITQATAEVVLAIPQKSELINQTSMTADEDGNPYIATYFKPQGSNVPQYQLIYFNGKSWQVNQVSNRQTPFSLSGVGTKKIPISRPQIIVGKANGKLTAIMLYRDEENGSVASAATCKDLATNSWATKNITTTALDNWEPSYDTELWKQSKKLHIFIQKAGQGDGEKLENLAPQPVYVLEWKP
jgi:hypothetical protein